MGPLMIQFNCPQCGNPFSVSDAAAGRVGTCKKCGGKVRVPQVGPAVVVPPLIAVPPIPPVPPGQLPQGVPLATSVVRATTAASAPANVEVKTAGRSATHSFGIASLVLGIVAFLIAWIPLVGFVGAPLGGIGLALALVGLVVSGLRGGAGIGYSIAGTMVCALALAIGWRSWLSSKPTVDALQNLLTDTTKNQTNQQPLRPAPKEQPAAPQAASPPQPPPKEEPWADALEGVRQGDVRIRVTKASIGRVPVRQLVGNGRKEVCLKIVVEIQNASQTQKVDYRGWSGGDVSLDAALGALGALGLKDTGDIDLKDAGALGLKDAGAKGSKDGPAASDEFGNHYKRVDFGIGAEVKGQLTSESIYPGKAVEDLLVFEKPVENAKQIRLELPARNFGDEGHLRLALPASAVVRE